MNSISNLKLVKKTAKCVYWILNHIFFDTSDWCLQTYIFQSVIFRNESMRKMLPKIIPKVKKSSVINFKESIQEIFEHKFLKLIFQNLFTKLFHRSYSSFIKINAELLYHLGCSKKPCWNPLDHFHSMICSYHYSYGFFHKGVM